jgi:hypothetical protein
MTEEAFNLVSKLIEEEGVGSSRLGGVGPGVVGLRMPVSAVPAHHHPHQRMHEQSGGIVLNLSDLSRNATGSSSVNINANLPNVSVSNSSVPIAIPPLVPPPVVSPAPSSPDVWFYRDPQGSVQGPFTTQEMGLWYTQGYFSGKLLLRRECDKLFITLGEMGKIYGRNPFVPIPDSPIPPPLQVSYSSKHTKMSHSKANVNYITLNNKLCTQDPNTSALDFPRSDGNQIQAQLQRQQQLLQQQNLLREQQQAQFMMK